MFTATLQGQMELWIDGKRWANKEWQGRLFFSVPFGSNKTPLPVHPSLVSLQTTPSEQPNQGAASTGEGSRIPRRVRRKVNFLLTVLLHSSVDKMIPLRHSHPHPRLARLR